MNVALGIKSGCASRTKPVSILRIFERRDDAIGGHQNWTVKGFEFFALFPPCITIIADKVRISFECRVVVGGQHFRVGVYVDASTLGLFEQHFKIFKVMT